MHKLLLLTFLLPYLAFSQTSNITANGKAIYPNSVWQITDDASNILKRFLIDSTNATGMVIIQSGKIIFGYGDIKETSYLASCRKSILSMLYGPFVANKKIDLSATIEQLHIDDAGGIWAIYNCFA